MAGDWIKMRPSLLSSPKVNGIARALEDSRDVSKVLTTGYSGYMSSIVTRDVMRSVTVTSLLIIWGAANEHTSDGIFRNADLSDLDDMVGIPGFGEAMEAVGWAEFDKEQCCVILPNFNEYNTCGKDRTAESNRERQKRYREKKKAKSNVTGDVTDNGREEKSREEISIPDGIDRTAWLDYEDYRAKMPKKNHLTPKAREIAWKRLALLSMPDQKKIIETSIMNGWTGLFPPKGGSNGQTNHTPKLGAFEQRKAKLAEWEQSQKGGRVFDGEAVATND